MTDFTTKTRKLAGILAVPTWRAALRQHRVAAGVEHARVLRNLGPVTTVVDIGANRGQFALVARHCFPQARIVSFEPLAGPAALWRAVFAGDDRARLVEAAIGPEPGQATVTCPRGMIPLRCCRSRRGRTRCFPARPRQARRRFAWRGWRMK